MEMYDVIIVGSGPSGLTAAIYCTRADLKTLVIAGFTWGGQLQLTTEVENFPGFPEGIQGPDLMLNIRKQAEKFGATIVDANMDATDFSTMSGGPFTVTADGKTYTGKTLLIATGADAKQLGVTGEKELTGRGISYCATCDGAFFRNKHIIVVGGGDSAMEEANFLTNFAATVTLLHRRDTFRASQIMQDRVKANPKIKILLNSQIIEVIGEKKVEKVKIKTTSSVIPSGAQAQSRDLSQKSSDESDPSMRPSDLVGMTNEQITELPIDGIFVAIGHTPNTKVFKGVEITDKGYVRAQHGTHTNIEGIFVSGDVEDDRYQQAITAAGFGAQAALDIERYLVAKKGNL
jgi:thioredoxin reductase (NADPH)